MTCHSKITLRERYGVATPRSQHLLYVWTPKTSWGILGGFSYGV